MNNRLKEYILDDWSGGLIRATKFSIKDVVDCVQQELVVEEIKISAMDIECTHVLSNYEKNKHYYLCSECGEYISVVDCDIEFFIRVINFEPNQRNCFKCKHSKNCLLCQPLTKAINNSKKEFIVGNFYVPEYSKKSLKEAPFKALARSCGDFEPILESKIPEKVLVS